MVNNDNDSSSGPQVAKSGGPRFKSHGSDSSSSSPAPSNCVRSSPRVQSQKHHSCHISDTAAAAALSSISRHASSSDCRQSSMYFWKSDVPSPSCLDGSLSLVSVNVNGLRDADKLFSFLQWLLHLSLSMVCLQDTSALSSDELSVWFLWFGYLCLSSFGSSHSCGVAILYDPVLTCSTVCDFDSHFGLAEFTFGDSVFCVACCYAPNHNPDHDAFLHYCIDSIDPSICTPVWWFQYCSWSFCWPSWLLSVQYLPRKFCPFAIVVFLEPQAPWCAWFHMVEKGWLSCFLNRSCWVSVLLDLFCFFGRHATYSPYSDHSVLNLSWSLSSAQPHPPALVFEIEYFHFGGRGLF